MFYEDDLDIYYSDFGVDVTFDGKTIRAIIDSRYTGLMDQRGFEPVESYEYMARVKTTDITGISHDDTITWDGVDYYVKNIQHTGSGETLLFLSEEQ